MPCSRRTEIAIDLGLMPERESSGAAGRSPGERLGRWVLGGILAASLLSAVLLSAEIALLLAEQNDRRRLDPLFRSNLFAARAEHAYEGSLWKKRWHSYWPNARFSRRVGDLYYEVRINRWGFRTQDFEKRKPQLVFRVVCIGASTTVQGPTNETTYPALLQEMLLEIAENVRSNIEAEVVVSESNDPRSYRLSSDKLLATGFKPKRSVEQAMDEMIQLYRDGVLQDNESFHTVKWMKSLYETGVLKIGG